MGHLLAYMNKAREERLTVTAITFNRDSSHIPMRTQLLEHMNTCSRPTRIIHGWRKQVGRPLKIS